MTYYLLKIVVTTTLIVAISEIAKRSTLIGAILASIPLVSVMAMIWLYIDTKDATKVSALATSIFWLVIPSLALFITLPLLIRQGIGFYLSISIAIVVTIISYALMVSALRNIGVEL